LSKERIKIALVIQQCLDFSASRLLTRLIQCKSRLKVQKYFQFTLLRNKINKIVKIPFFKYQGTGNDFVMIDQRQQQFLQKSDVETINHLCDRRFGIGADGLILLENPKKGVYTATEGSPDKGGKGSPSPSEKENFDFQMIYFNADGRESSMCGNGGRCLVAFANYLQVFDNQCIFNAIDGLHDAKVRADGWIELKMIDVNAIEIGKDYFLMNTGSPHFVVFVEDLTDINVYENGREIRYSERFYTEGVNVNFVEIKKDGSLEVATYERGVEAETFSCGTGVTAAAIAFALKKTPIFAENKALSVPILTKGGNLEVRLQRHSESGFKDLWLCGPAVQAFQGEVNIA
jgi:diaminopimelate epimerase